MEELTLKDKVDYLYDKEKPKSESMKTPRKARLSRSKLKKGYMTILRIDDNKNCVFEKQKVEESTYRLKTGDYHALENQDVLSLNGKPFVIQPIRKLNPWNPLDGKNETYGQKYVMARMLADTIKVKARSMGIILIVGIIIAAIIAINYFSKGG